MRNVSPENRWSQKLVVAMSITLAWAALAPTASAETGEGLFKTRCAACHSIGGGRLVGPDLAGLSERRSQEWFIRFVKSPKTMLDAGDETAVALYAEFNPILMPDQALSDAEIVSVVQYIGSGAGAAVAPASAPVAAAGAEPSQADIERGQALFQGTARLENGGPTCNSCHDVVNDAVIGGGILARELTTVFGRLGGPGVRAILGSPPFPVMQQAYADRSLAQDEVTALVAFLQSSDRNHALQQPRDYGPKLASSGVAGSAVLLGLYTLLWRRRRRMSVNQGIYDRQISSSN